MNVKGHASCGWGWIGLNWRSGRVHEIGIEEVAGEHRPVLKVELSNSCSLPMRRWKVDFGGLCLRDATCTALNDRHGSLISLDFLKFSVFQG